MQHVNVAKNYIRMVNHMDYFMTYKMVLHYVNPYQKNVNIVNHYIHMVVVLIMVQYFFLTHCIMKHQQVHTLVSHLCVKHQYGYLRI